MAAAPRRIYIYTPSNVLGWTLNPGLLGISHASVRPRDLPNELGLEAVAKSWSESLIGSKRRGIFPSDAYVILNLAMLGPAIISIGSKVMASLKDDGILKSDKTCDITGCSVSERAWDLTRVFDISGKDRSESALTVSASSWSIPYSTGSCLS